MDSEVKWYFIALAVIFGLGAIGVAYSEHGKQQCRIAAIEARLLPADVEKICK